MDRRAVALRNRRVEMNKVMPGQPAGGDFQNNFHHKGNRPTLNGSQIHAVNDVNNAVGPSLESGQCIVCKKHAICVCERCADYYCSPQCQKVDWPSHRYICFPLPRLVNPTNALSCDVVYPSENPLLTVRQFNSLPKQNFQNFQQPDFSLNGRQQQQQQQTFVTNSIKVPQVGTNQVQQKKEPTATVPVAEMPKNNSHVKLTGFRTPNRCYVRAVTPAIDDDCMLNARKIDVYGKIAKPLGKMPKVHSYAIAPYNGIMHRVEVLMARNSQNIRLLFIDRGIVESRRLKDLREITDEIILLKQYACLIPLSNVTNYVLNETMVKQFATYEDLDFKIKYHRIEDHVELLHWQTEKSLNEEIENFCKEIDAEIWGDSVRARVQGSNQKKGKPGAKSDETMVNNHKEKSFDEGNVNGEEEEHDDQFYAISANDQNSMVSSNIKIPQKQPKKEEQKVTEEEIDKGVKNIAIAEERPTMEAPYETYYFKVGCAPFKAVVLDVSFLYIGYIGCIAKEDLACLQTVHKQLESIKVSDKPYKPQLNEYCIAKFEDMWYRAQVTDIPDQTHFTVTYIDFTNEATLTSDDIRHYPSGTATGICKTNLCLIYGLPATDFSDELTQFLNNEIELQSIIDIDSVNSIDDQVVVIECRSLLEKIRKKNLL
ncbi:uncharacterized protein LOC101455781 [Ceratitis capitata]|uniref:(Mediterranean fruit fly) hypothetical protein n=1 Tax=Ceratitis capitata TaxID=7213 RepID=W8BP64_CERCA|nr:uncharacterized protein LOC101455781 [Ceratitis capitata]CAD6992714.1 unnamed protein product [Ceratitis capitata]